MPAANDLRKGQAIKYNNDTYVVLEVHHRTPGNLRAFVQAIIRSIKTGKSSDVRFSSTEKVELVDLQRRPLEFSYKDHQGYHFMDPESYESLELDENLISSAKDYLVENLKVDVLYGGFAVTRSKRDAAVESAYFVGAIGCPGPDAANGNAVGIDAARLHEYARQRVEHRRDVGQIIALYL